MTILDNPQVNPLAKLREKFPDAAVGKLPRLTCPDCREAPGKVCGHHQKSKCSACGNYISSAHVDLDYVGHAEVTDRLLSADPEWAWEPLSREVDPHLMASAIETGNPEMVRLVLEQAPPRFVCDDRGRPKGLWIKLTVAGVTRLGYGSLDKPKLDGEKELIGDALRNAAMRFGVALDLWSKTELESSTESTETSSGPPKPPETEAWRQLGYTDADHMKVVNDELQAHWRALPETRRVAIKEWLRDQGYDRPVPVHARHAATYSRLLTEQPVEKPLNPKVAAVLAYVEAQGKTSADLVVLASHLHGKPARLEDLDETDAVALESLVGDLVAGDILIHGTSVVTS